ncbi:MAG: hypothetical protein DHS20C18_46170 [Saprospiraceae bacterium]|nr:MAG: hypothetical protein DHS20C18_46170 [Saprospiraceae bacterium]
MKKYLLFLFVPVLLGLYFPETDLKMRSGKDFALFIAVEDYQEWPDLRNPVSDARAVAKELETEYGFTTEVLTNPRRNEIYTVLEKYRNLEYSDDSQLLIFISGHGDFREGTREGFFIPTDGLLNDAFQDTYIPHTRLERIVDNIPCKHILLAIDACYSGTFDEDIALSKSRPSQDLGKLDEVNLFVQRQLKHHSRLYLTSGGKERTPDGQNYSPFTQHFLEGLRSYGINDDVLTYTELLGFMEVANPKPRSGQFGSHEPGGSFLFVTRKAGAFAKVEKQNKPEVSLEPEKKPAQQPKVDKTTSSATVSIRDPRDGQQYLTKQINQQTWLTQNLNVKTTNSWCYNNKQANCDEYGRLYSYEDAVKVCQGLGTGWHLPSGNEWQNMIRLFGGLEGDSDDNGAKALEELKKNGSSGFDVKFGGEKFYSSSFSKLGSFGNYWTSTTGKNNGQMIIGFSNNGPIYYKESSLGSKNGYSCRCVKN